MFVDAGQVSLLSALAGGSVYVTPTVIHAPEIPPFFEEPTAEFAKGIYIAQHDLSQPLHATRVQRRTAFYEAVGTAWSPVALSDTELQLTRYLVSPVARQAARLIDPTIKNKRIQAGEAEAAAVAVTRGWTLWSDDAAIRKLLAALHPGHPIERIGSLVMRAAQEGLIGCQEAADLYNDLFRGVLGLWTTLTLDCNNGQVVVRQGKAA